MPPPTGAGPVLRFGDRGEFVRTLQMRLESLGFSPGAIDGVFGSRTDRAVRDFQASRNLLSDGIVGPVTRGALGLDILGHTSIVPGLSSLISYRYPTEGYQTGGFTANTLIQGYDANVRITQYVRPAQRVAEQLLADVESGKLSHMEGRQAAANQRNNLLSASRERLSPGGREFSKALKEEGKALSELVHKYSRKVLEGSPALRKQYGLKTLDPKSPLFNPALYERAIEELGRSEQVSKEIIKASGRTSGPVTALARFSRVAGPVGTGIGLTMSAYEIVNAPAGQRGYVAGREASGFAGGLVGSVGGGLLAGWTASLLCGPGAPVCAIAVSIVIVGGSAYAGSSLFESGYERLMNPGRSGGTGRELRPGTYLGMGAYLDENMIVRQGPGPKY